VMARPLRGLERDHRGDHDRRLNVTWDRSSTGTYA